MEVESQSRDARGQCNLGASGLQGGDVTNARRGETALGPRLCTPSCQ